MQSPAFSVFITLAAFEAGLFINRKTKLEFLNPLFVGMLLVIGFVYIADIDYEAYREGGQIITFLLVPATVVLALPLFRQFSLLKQNAGPIIVGIVVGSAANIALILLASKYFIEENVTKLSLVPKSVTTPIGIELSKQLGGIPEITVAAIIITGITGAIIGRYVFKLLRIKDKVAIGVAMGTSAHALGTAKAIEMGETEGAMSGLSIGIAGLVTVFLAPLMINLLF